MSGVGDIQDSPGTPMMAGLVQDAPTTEKMQFPLVGKKIGFHYPIVTTPFVSTTGFRIRTSSASSKSIDGIQFYKPGYVSLGRIAEICGLYYDETIREIANRGLHLDFGPESIEEARQEIESLRRHMRRRT